MLRLSKPGGILGISDQERDNMLLRVGAPEYKALFPEIKQYSLEERMKIFLKVYEENELKEELKEVNLQLQDLKDEFNIEKCE